MIGTRPTVLAQALLLAASITALTSSARAQYCPSYTPDVEPKCAHFPAPGTNPTVAEWQAIFDTVARGPSEWGDAGPDVADIASGCDKPTAKTMVAAKYPCEILKAIARQESGWQHFCVPTAPASEKGKESRTIVSFDCGYGIGQVTSGMRTADATPTYDPVRVTNDPTYNLATGTMILAQKWRGTDCVGDRNPTVVEDWYTSTWAYNGLAFKNNPTNPIYSSTRGVWNPQAGGSAPYQEKVWGWVEHPPTAAHWDATPLAYPKLGEMGSTGKPGALTEPECASPTDCVGKRPTHVSACFGGTPGPDMATSYDLLAAPDLAEVVDLGVTVDGSAPPPTGVDIRGGCAVSSGAETAELGGVLLLAAFVMTMVRGRALVRRSVVSVVRGRRARSK